MDEEDTNDAVLNKYRMRNKPNNSVRFTQVLYWKDTASGMVLSIMAQRSAAHEGSFAAGFVCTFERSKTIYLRKLLVLMPQFPNCVCMWLYVQMASSITRHSSNCFDRAFHVLFSCVSSLPVSSWNFYFWVRNFLFRGKECIHEQGIGSAEVYPIVHVAVSVQHCMPGTPQSHQWDFPNAEFLMPTLNHHFLITPSIVLTKSPS